ncbi:MAG: trigger factor [Eubacteriales bacterium]|nr:trigger factor [Eubacteriales bacterium]
MSVQVERLEHNMAKLTIEVDAKEFEAAMKRAYNKQKSSFNMPGFRKGKVPMNVVEKTYGAGVFYEDAANDCMQTAYPTAVEESGLDIVSRPDVEVTQIGKGQNLIFTATVAVKPEVTLGEYKGLTLEKDSVEVTDAEVEAKLVEEQEKNAREVEVEDRPVKDGDIITLNYAGTIDGAPFDGGTASNQNLTIGSHSFIDTFEDQLVGLNIGDEKDVEVTFPEEYHAEELAGKPAVFHVEILGIKEKQLEEINDDFAQDHTEFDSLEEYKADIREKLTAGKEENAKRNMEEAAIEQVIENATVDIPEAMVEGEVDQMVEEFKQRVAYQGLSFEQYLQFTGSDINAFRDSMKEQAEKRVKVSLVLEAIAKAETIEASDEDLNAEFERMAEMYQMEASQIASYMDDAAKENMKSNLAVQKAVDFIIENATITEASEALEFEAE